jgi:septal ring factor EnvC (AmiA/AmiB activator)
MAKNNLKSVRMSDETLSIVLNYKNGTGFNEKFENLVNEFDKSVPDRKKKLDKIETDIKKKQKELEEIEKKIYLMKDLQFNLETLKNKILDVEKLSDKIKNVSQ